MFIAELTLPQFSSFDLSTLRTGIMAGSVCPMETMKAVRPGPLHAFGRANVRTHTKLLYAAWRAGDDPDAPARHDDLLRHDRDLARYGMALRRCP